jgi:hypothetical protein
MEQLGWICPVSMANSPPVEPKSLSIGSRRSYSAAILYICNSLYLSEINKSQRSNFFGRKAMLKTGENPPNLVCM